MPRFAVVIGVAAAILFLLLLYSPPPIATASPVPQVMGTPGTDRLAKPVLPPNPTQADKGAEVYWLTCMACHGDRGQGLTQEWREAWDPEDQNCWQSKCHAANHPPGGFVLPRYVPPIIGPNTLQRFQTVLDLYEYIKAKMPWHAPGTLSDEEYWQLAAYLARANGANVGTTPLDRRRAAALRLHPGPETPDTIWLAWALVAIGGLSSIGLGIWWVRRRMSQPEQIT